MCPLKDAHECKGVVVKRYLNFDEVCEVVRDFGVLDEAAFENARRSGNWDNDSGPSPSVCVGPDAYGWDDAVVSQWLADHGVDSRMSQLIVRGSTGHAKTSLMHSYSSALLMA